MDTQSRTGLRGTLNELGWIRLLGLGAAAVLPGGVLLLPLVLGFRRRG
tara:strand:- start:1124 stop:1267 length:144 start_codon:yes stop_codon:yes gene_type:complete